MEKLRDACPRETDLAKRKRWPLAVQNRALDWARHTWPGIWFGLGAEDEYCRLAE
jgi:hypothetical protein